MRRLFARQFNKPELGWKFLKFHALVPLRRESC